MRSFWCTRLEISIHEKFQFQLFQPCSGIWHGSVLSNRGAHQNRDKYFWNLVSTCKTYCWWIDKPKESNHSQCSKGFSTSKGFLFLHLSILQNQGSSFLHIFVKHFVIEQFLCPLLYKWATRCTINEYCDSNWTVQVINQSVHSSCIRYCSELYRGPYMMMFTVLYCIRRMLFF